VSVTQHTRLRLIALGGTIAFDTSDAGALPELAGRDLIERAGNGNSGVDTLDLASISSIAITSEHLLQLLAAIEQSIGDGYTGIVVTHGTDTIEETAYFLALTIPRGRAAIVLTGAMRHNGLLGADGPANVRDALTVAQMPAALHTGPLVVMAGEIHTARFVTKAHATRHHALGSNTGPLGQISEDQPEIWFQPRYDDYVGRPTSGNRNLPRVEQVTMTIGNEPHALSAAIRTQPAGLVIAGLGGGHIPPQLLRCVDDAVQRDIPVIIGSRCGDPSTLHRTYAIPGTEIDLQERGALMSGTLSPPKARLRLSVALANGLPPAAAFPVK
jgi:L-asparaginase